VSTACPRRHDPPPGMAVLVLVRAADTPAEGKAYRVKCDESARVLGRDESGASRRAEHGVSTKRGLILMLLLMIPLSLLTVSFTSVRLNISRSLPLGLYRLHPVARPLTRGTPVIVHVPGWSARTVPFLKPVAAVAGEWVCRVGPMLVIDHRNYGPVHEAWRGDPLPSAIAADTCATVPPGHVFLATAAPPSLDSRYYGPVAVGQIAATATPLWTWGTADAATYP
jgi:type IV secretory pathway protease TraF